MSLAFPSGEFDIGFLIFKTIMMSLVFYMIFRFSYRTIKVYEDQYIYDGLMRKIKIKYINIEKICVIDRSDSKESSFSLIISEKSDWQISTIQMYRKNEMEAFVRKMGSKSKLTKTEVEEVIVGLSDVSWLHD